MLQLNERDGRQFNRPTELTFNLLRKIIMKALRTTIAFVTFAALSSAFAGPLNQGMVGGQFKSNVHVGSVNQSNTATLGNAKQELNVGSVNGGKAIGNVELNVDAKDINQTNKAMLGNAEQSVNIGTLR
jgi:hypothetical protein